jgi:hypothetical protein
MPPGGRLSFVGSAADATAAPANRLKPNRMSGTRRIVLVDLESCIGEPARFLGWHWRPSRHGSYNDNGIASLQQRREYSAMNIARPRGFRL